MTPELAVEIFRHTLMETFWLSLPLLAIGFVVGIGVSLLQVLTSIQDTSFGAVPRLTAFLVGVLLMLPWMTTHLIALYDRAVGRFWPLCTLSSRSSSRRSMDFCWRWRGSRAWWSSCRSLVFPPGRTPAAWFWLWRSPLPCSRLGRSRPLKWHPRCRSHGCLESIVRGSALWVDGGARRCVSAGRGPNGRADLGPAGRIFLRLHGRSCDPGRHHHAPTHGPASRRHAVLRLRIRPPGPARAGERAWNRRRAAPSRWTDAAWRPLCVWARPSSPPVSNWRCRYCALLVLLDVAFAVLGRLHAQLQLLSLSFAVKMLVALALLAAMLSVYPAVFERSGAITFRVLDRVLNP